MMHGVRSTTRPAAIGLVSFGLTGCVSLIAKKNSYAAASPAVKVNGAEVRMRVKPEGTAGGSYAISAMVVSTAVTTFDGPFRWRVEATGTFGKQDSLIVHRIRTRTLKSKRDEWYPAAGLGRRADFKRPLGENGPVTAVYDIPGLLMVKPLEDGPMELSVDLTVSSEGRSQRKVVRFRMDPSRTKQNEFIFVPTEIAESIGKPPSQWEETGWD